MEGNPAPICLKIPAFYKCCFAEEREGYAQRLLLDQPPGGRHAKRTALLKGERIRKNGRVSKRRLEYLALAVLSKTVGLNQSFRTNSAAIPWMTR